MNKIFLSFLTLFRDSKSLFSSQTSLKPSWAEWVSLPERPRLKVESLILFLAQLSQETLNTSYCSAAEKSLSSEIFPAPESDVQFIFQTQTLPAWSKADWDYKFPPFKQIYIKTILWNARSISIFSLGIFLYLDSEYLSVECCWWSGNFNLKEIRLSHS